VFGFFCEPEYVIFAGKKRVVASFEAFLDVDGEGDGGEFEGLLENFLFDDLEFVLSLEFGVTARHGFEVP
jgi:hypothetical protein